MILMQRKESNMNEEIYGIDKEYGHPRAVELIPDEFFWNNFNELAPFGSDEGDTALAEFREWRKQHPTTSVLECIKWTIESVGEINFSQYNSSLLDDNLIKKQLKDEDFDFEQSVNTLDISVIATGFGQLADEGKIDVDAKPIIKIALDRQFKVTHHKYYSEDAAQEYRSYLIKLLEVLPKA
jgi:uncharacterized protein YfeS